MAPTKIPSARTRNAGRPRRPPAQNRRRSTGAVLGWTVVGAVVVLVVLAVVVRDGQDDTRAPSAEGRVAHVHGLGIDPADQALYAATHLGLYRVPAQGRAERAGDAVQDTMGFAVVGPGHFLGSGHPDPKDKHLRIPGRPPLLGLIETTDGGEAWKPLSLLGEADFHSLVAAIWLTAAIVLGLLDGADRVLRSVAGRSLFLAARDPLGAARGHRHGFIGVVASALVTRTGISRVCPVNPVVGFESSSS